MSHQCVPRWDLDDHPSKPRLANSNFSNSLPPSVPSLDYEVAELTWENGQLAMHGLHPSRMADKRHIGTWDKPRAGTLESLVDQATSLTHMSGGDAGHNVPPWVDRRGDGAADAARTLDALVPCNNDRHRHNHHVGDSIPGKRALAGACGCKSASESTGAGGGEGIREKRHVAGSEKELCAGGYTSTSVWSPENTSSGKDYAKTNSVDDRDSISHSRSQSEDQKGKKKKGSGKSSVSTKRSRAAAIHNQSERKRRDKINQRMKTLQKLVPNSSKTDKASILDEVIEYLKQLQAQVNMMSRMNMPHMMMPLALQQLQMSMMAPPMAMPGLGVMTAPNGLPPMIPQTTPIMPPLAPTSGFMPMSPWDIPADRAPSALAMPPELLPAFLACQSQQPMSVDGYARLAALYQQYQQNPASGSKN